MGKFKDIFKKKQPDGVAEKPSQIIEDEYEPTPVMEVAQPQVVVSEAVAVRRNGTPSFTPVMVVREVSDMDSMSRTMIIRYPRANMLDRVRGIVRQYKRKTAESYISKFIDVDIFVNINRSPSEMRGNNWLSVVYECTEGNDSLSAIKRYPDAFIVTIDEVYNEYQLDGTTITLDMLLGGGR